MRRIGRIAIAALALTAALAGCGGDDDDDDAAGAQADLAAFCEAANEVETLGEPEVDWETASDEEIMEATKQFARERVLPVATRVQENAPEEISDAVSTLIAATNELADTGNFEEAFETPEVQEADAAFHEAHVSECELETVDVTAVDYAFNGVPDTLEAGFVSFELTNDGDEPHEMVVFRKNDGVEQSFEELVEAEADDQVTFVAGSFAEPGDDAYAVAELKAGDYAMVCFIPVGASAEGPQEGEEEGPPHFTRGMLSEFTVE